MNQNTISFAYQGKANKFKTTESSNPIDLKKKNKKQKTKKQQQQQKRPSGLHRVVC
jgi:hypothetical protein